VELKSGVLLLSQLRHTKRLKCFLFPCMNNKNNPYYMDEPNYSVICDSRVKNDRSTSENFVNPPGVETQRNKNINTVNYYTS
jgi:hypothetical protein